MDKKHKKKERKNKYEKPHPFFSNYFSNVFYQSLCKKSV